MNRSIIWKPVTFLFLITLKNPSISKYNIVIISKNILIYWLKFYILYPNLKI